MRPFQAIQESIPIGGERLLTYAEADVSYVATRVTSADTDTVFMREKMLNEVGLKTVRCVEEGWMIRRFQ